MLLAITRPGPGVPTFSVGTTCGAADELATYECGDAKVIVDYGRCYGRDTAFYDIGPTVRGPVMQQVAGTCNAVSGGSVFVRLGARAPERYPMLSLAAVGDGPVRALAWSDARGTLLRAAGMLEDANTGAPCTSTRVGGVLRCLPGDALRYAMHFADAACTAPIVAVGAPETCAPEPRVPDVALVSRGSCDAELRAVGQVHDGALYARTDGVCARVDAPLGQVFFRLAGPVDPARYPLVTERVE